jgi:hypothetical protein
VWKVYIVEIIYIYIYIEEDHEARVKLLLNKTKGAQYALIIEDNNESGGTAAHRVQYYLNN